MSRHSASVVAQFGAKTAQYNRAVLNAVKVNTEYLRSIVAIKSETTDTSRKTNVLSGSFSKIAIKVTSLVILIKRLTTTMLKLGDASSRAEEIQQKFDIVFRHNRMEVQKWADTLADSINRNSTNIEAFAAHLQNTFVPLGFMREESTNLSKALVELALDLGSFNDIPTERVINDIRAALLGNVRAVRKYGVSANETAIFQEALVNGWVKEKSEIDAVIKARAINNIILRSTRDAQGDLSRTMHQTANVRRAYNEQVERSRELLGDYVNFFLTPIRKKLVDIIEGWNQAKESKLAYLKEIGGEDSGRIDLAIDRVKTLIEEQVKLIDLIDKGLKLSFRSSEEERTNAEARLKKLKDQLIMLQHIESFRLREQQDVADTLKLEDEAEKARLEAFKEEQEREKSRKVALDIYTELYIIDLKNYMDALDEKIAADGEAKDEALKNLDLIDEARRNFYASIPSMIGDVASQVSQLFNAIYQRDLEQFEYANEVKEKTRDEAYEAEKDRIESEIKDKHDRDKALEELSKNHAETEKDIAEELETERRKLQYESAMQAWRLNLLGTAAAGAQAQINAWTQTPFVLPVAIASSALAAALTALSLGTVTASKPIKNFQTGTSNFIVPDGYPNDSYNVGLTSGEKLTVDTPNQQADSEGNGIPMNIYMMWNDTEVGRIFTRSIRNRDTIIHMEDIT